MVSRVAQTGQLVNSCSCTARCVPQSLEQYKPADIALSLCRMISYNIGQLAYLNAKR